MNTKTQADRQTFAFTVWYFKPSGKLYTEATFARAVRTDATGGPYMPDVASYLRGLRDAGGEGALPGLRGDWDGPIVVNCKAGYPCLIPQCGA